MYKIADLKKKVMDCLLAKDLDGMSLEELERLVDLAGKTAAIPERDFMENYTEFLKGLACEKKEMALPAVMGIGTLGKS